METKKKNNSVQVRKKGLGIFRIKTKKKDIKGDSISKNQNKFVNMLKHNRKRILLIVLIALIICIIVYSTVFIRRLIISKKYAKYEEKMNLYGFNLLYDNKKATSYEKVSKLEMIKLVLGSIYNTDNITLKGCQPENKYKDDEWGITAKVMSIIDEKYIDKENYKSSVTYWEMLETYLNAREKILEYSPKYNKESSFSNLNSLDDKQRLYLNDAVENGILKDDKKSIKLDKTLLKYQANELVINFVEKYNTILPEGEEIVTKENSKPKNYKDYPYILYSIPNNVYEIEHIGKEDSAYVSPKNLYATKKEYYAQIQNNISEYYEKILNVDCNSITVDEFKTSVEDLLIYRELDDVYQNYVDYVKENKIQLKGSIKVYLPIFYCQGPTYMLRAKAKFEVVNSNTDKNLIFGDLKSGKDYIYKENIFEKYIDIPVNRLITVETYRTLVTPIQSLIVGE